VEKFEGKKTPSKKVAASCVRKKARDAVVTITGFVQTRGETPLNETFSIEEGKIYHGDRPTPPTRRTSPTKKEGKVFKATLA